MKKKIKNISPETILVEYNNLKLKNSIVIQGVHGIGRVGQLAVSYILRQKEPKKLLEFYSGYMGNFLLLTDRGRAVLPSYEVYHFKDNDQDYIIIYSDAPFQAFPEKGNFELAYLIFQEIYKRYKPSLIVTMGGIMVGQEEEPENVYYLTNSNDLDKRLKDLKIESLSPSPRTMQVVGFTGVLHGLATIYEIESVCFLAEVLYEIGDMKATKRVLEVLNKLFDFKLNMKEIEEELKREEEELQKILTKTEEILKKIKSTRDSYRI